MSHGKPETFPHPEHEDLASDLKAVIEKHLDPPAIAAAAPGDAPSAIDPASIAALIQAFITILGLFRKK